MGIADLVPGISGGTVAFILGIWERLIAAIGNLKKEFFKSVAFIGPVVSGIVLAIFFFAKTINSLLNSPVEKICLYSAFFGLILASCVLCFSKVRVWSISKMGLVGLFSGLAFLMTFLSAGGESGSYGTFWIIFCGAAAISAMLLPGISGSYLLVILGMYGDVLGNTVQFVTALKSGGFDGASFLFLAKFAFGIVLGAALFSKVISHFFDRYHDIAMASLAGFVLGSLRSVWPGAAEVDFPVLGVFLIALGGFSLVFFIEFLAKKKSLLTQSN